jgi:hypothetical protein
MPIATRHELTPVELLHELPWESPDTLVHITVAELKALIDQAIHDHVAAALA